VAYLVVQAFKDDAAGSTEDSTTSS